MDALNIRLLVMMYSNCLLVEIPTWNYIEFIYDAVECSRKSGGNRRESGVRLLLTAIQHALS